MRREYVPALVHMARQRRTVVHSLATGGGPNGKRLSIQLQMHCMHSGIAGVSPATSACRREGRVHANLPIEAHEENTCTAALLEVTVVPLVGKEMRDSQSVVRTPSVHVVLKHQHREMAHANRRMDPGRSGCSGASLGDLRCPEAARALACGSRRPSREIQRNLPRTAVTSPSANAALQSMWSV